MDLMKAQIAMLLACIGVLAGAGCAKTEPAGSGASATTKYTCPMHPEVLQDKPGSCPKCGMKLVEKK
jgi:hypothetical protein